MNNKKLFPLAVLTTALIVGLVSGCGGDGKIHVTFWHTLGKSNQILMDSLITDFQAKYPDYKIDSSSNGGYDDLKDKILTTLSSGTNPVMAFCYPDHVADYLGSGASVIPLDSYFKDPEVGFTEEDGSHLDGETIVYGEDDYIQGYWEEGKTYAQEGTYSVPYAKSTEVMFYNKRAFEAMGYPVPTKWFNDDDPNDLTAMFNLTRKILEDKATDPEFVAPLGYDSDSNLYITLSHQLGIPYTTQADKVEDRFPFASSQDAKNMVSKLKSLYGTKEDKTHHFITKGVNNGGYTSTLFAEQKILMSIGSTGGTSYNLGDFEVGIAPIPQQDPIDHKGVLTQGPSICLFRNSNDAQKKGAWLFYRHITTDINSTRYAIETGYEPVRISSYNTPQYQDHIAVPEDPSEDTIFKKVARLTATMQDDYFNTPVFKGSATAREAVGGIISNVLLGTMTVDQAFAEAYSQCIYA